MEGSGHWGQCTLCPGTMSNWGHEIVYPKHYLTNEPVGHRARDWRTANKKFPVFTSSNNRVARLVTVACKAYE